MNLIRSLSGILLLIIPLHAPATGSSTESDSLQKAGLQHLRTLLQTQTRWIKVHAAEYLLWLNEPTGVQEVYLEELRRFGTESPYRIGIWRVLAQAAGGPAEKQPWLDRIGAAFLDPGGPDRVHAVESLAKLGVSPQTLDVRTTQMALAGPDQAFALYTLWGTTLADQASVTTNRRKFLAVALNRQEEAALRRLGAYILRRLGELTEADWTALAGAALTEPSSSGVRAPLLHAALVTCPAGLRQSGRYPQVRTELLAMRASSSVSDLLELMTALSQQGEPADVPVLLPFLNHENADVQAGAAYALVKILRPK